MGVGSGRQYAFLRPLGVALRGFDISPTLAATARSRYPDIATTVDTVIGAETRYAPADAVLSTTVLQHVPPDEIEAATQAVKLLARRLVILRETTCLTRPSTYHWAHDYDRLFGDWRPALRTVTDTTTLAQVEFMAWERPPGRDTRRAGRHSTTSSSPSGEAASSGG